ncbi:MAG: EAL domain-containing protein [Thiogranum sp.]
MKLRTKILLLLIPLIVVPMLTMGWVAYSELNEKSKQKAFAEMRAAINHLAGHLELDIETAAANIELFANHTLIRKYILTSDEEERYTLLQGPTLRALRSFQEAYPSYYEIRILLPDGYEDIRRTSITSLDNLTEEEDQNPLFLAMLRSGYSVSSLIFRNPDNGKLALFVGKPLILRDPAIDATGTPATLRGYLALTIDLDELVSHVSSDVIGKSGYLLVTDNQGNTLIQPGTVAVEKNRLRDALDTIAGRPFPNRPVKAVLNEHSSYITEIPLLNDLHLLAVLPEREITDIRNKLALSVIAIMLVSILVTASALFLVLQRLVIAPIQRLGVLSREIGRGNLDIESGLTSNDEIGTLATAFESMAGSLRKSDEQIRYVAYHDTLTGLPNRAMFHEYLNHVIAHAHRNRKQFALLFLDVDDFKRINDTLGHETGDLLLQEATERLANCLRDTDYVARMGSFDEPDEFLARLGGDEFIILLPDISDQHAPGTLAHRLIEALSQPFSMSEHKFYVSASIGITLYPVDGEEGAELVKNADIAMYHAKEQGKNNYQYYLESMNALAHERLSLEHKLRRSLENNELCLHYQPQVEAASGRIVGVEALLRWFDPDQGLIPPDVFIPVAENSGLILPIGEWVINEACRQNKAWQKAGLEKIVVSVNISGIQFARQNVPDVIKAALQKSRLPPAFLEAEITESVIMDQPERAIKQLSDLRELGIGIALDDFGTGYSSFSYLHRFPIDTLKIDRSFISDICRKTAHAEIVAAIIAMSHILKLRVVAEGIEEEEQLSLLTDKDCDVVQGYLFSRPVPAEEITQLLAKRTLKTA